MSPAHEVDVRACPICGQAHGGARDAACDALRAAREAGERPPGVPVRVQAAYVEARQAIRRGGHEGAIRSLTWLLAHLAEIRGVDPKLDLHAKITALMEGGIVAKTMRRELLERALSDCATGPEAAWALMTLVEHALARAYLGRGGAP